MENNIIYRIKYYIRKWLLLDELLLKFNWEDIKEIEKIFIIYNKRHKIPEWNKYCSYCDTYHLLSCFPKWWRSINSICKEALKRKYLEKIYQKIQKIRCEYFNKQTLP